MELAHDLFVQRQEICVVHEAWYCHEENYYGLMACRRLDTHERFYVVEETGLVLVPVVE